MNNFKLIYRCRRCGREDSLIASSGEGMQAALLVMANRVESPLHVQRVFANEPPINHFVHRCSENEFGISDLIGANKE